VAIGNPIRADGHFADLSDQGDRDALENRNLLRGLAESMVVKFADYWKEETGQYPARLLFDWRATTYASLSQLTEAPGCGSGHSFRFVRCFPYLVAGRGVARNSAGFGKRTANCNAF
jgi:hypothetical protein